MSNSVFVNDNIDEALRKSLDEGRCVRMCVCLCVKSGLYICYRATHNCRIRQCHVERETGAAVELALAASGSPARVAGQEIERRHETKQQCRRVVGLRRRAVWRHLPKR